MVLGELSRSIVVLFPIFREWVMSGKTSKTNHVYRNKSEHRIDNEKFYSLVYLNIYSRINRPLLIMDYVYNPGSSLLLCCVFSKLLGSIKFT